MDAVISCLGLTEIKYSVVGSPDKPTISGGQRKRVSIGMEIAAAPMAIFLDEPTSGLDASSATSVMKLLHALTRHGMTIVVIIHQPRPEIFATIDSLLLLSGGETVYVGYLRFILSHPARHG